MKYYFLHLMAATFGAAIVALAPYAILSPFLREPLLPAAIVGGALSGYLVNRKLKTSSASFAWMLPLAWLLFGILQQRSSFSEVWAKEDFASYIWDTFFGQNCGSSECLYELFFTGPFYSSLAYSIAALITVMVIEHTLTTKTEAVEH